MRPHYHTITAEYLIGDGCQNLYNNTLITFQHTGMDMAGPASEGHNPVNNIN